jgi:hypothetical protein
MTKPWLIDETRDLVKRHSTRGVTLLVKWKTLPGTLRAEDVLPGRMEIDNPSVAWDDFDIRSVGTIVVPRERGYCRP